MAFRSLAKQEQKRFDPMITGFNPTDLYAAAVALSGQRLPERDSSWFMIFFSLTCQD